MTALSSYKVVHEPTRPQTVADHSFCGGVPNLPAILELPRCSNCGHEMTFFFQIAFPKRHVWHGWSIAVFECTSCFDFDHAAPRALNPVFDPIPDDYVERYQTNFRVLVFSSASATMARTEARRVLQFVPLNFAPIRASYKYREVTKLGGVPAWEHEDQTGLGYENHSYMGGNFVFLMQTQYRWPFIPLPEAPSPLWAPPGWYERFRMYNLFNGARTYLLGTTSPLLDPPQVYIIPQ